MTAKDKPAARQCRYCRNDAVYMVRNKIFMARPAVPVCANHYDVWMYLVVEQIGHDGVWRPCGAKPATAKEK